jgi:nicotinamidase/pyrazinamidase
MNATATLRPRAGDALIIVDVQNDFLPGGALAVPHGDEVVSPLNRYAAFFERQGQPVFATRDWHSPDHCSFREQGGPWPAHCVAGTKGAQFAPKLALPPDARVMSKATTPDQDAYSGFGGTDLDAMLRRENVHRVFVGGLATDYCVLNTVKDARKLGYVAVLLQDAIRAVDVSSGDGRRAQEQMQRLGALPADLESLGA